jgi:pimeloyl-ACP methyl ester carboxylesterase
MRAMPRADVNGIRIEYEEFGPAEGRPLLLVMGLGAQMILWDEEFCELLVRRGHRVIRFDNRDVGLSSHLDHLDAPNPMEFMQAAGSGSAPEPPYRLADMAADSAALLDALGLASAHVAGASMGGMIAQSLAIEHPHRLRSLTSIMSSTGEPSLPPARTEAMQVLMTPAPPDREESVERAVAAQRVIGSPGFPFEEERVRERAGRSFDRSFHPEGMARQLVAIVASGGRRERLGAVRTPSLVIHGDADPLVPIEGGLDTHAAIPGAELLVIEGMGHDLPRPAWPRIVDAISKLTERAD